MDPVKGRRTRKEDLKGQWMVVGSVVAVAVVVGVESGGLGCGFRRS